LHIGRVSKVTLVKGKEIWRIVGAHELATRGDFAKEVAHLLERFIRGEGAHKSLFTKLTSLVSHNEFDVILRRLLAHYIILVDLGYADADVIGLGGLKGYKEADIDTLYTQLVLMKEQVRNHVKTILSEVQL
jgi:hypothetical protein